MTWVLPGVTSDVIEATERYVPAFLRGGVVGDGLAPTGGGGRRVDRVLVTVDRRRGDVHPARAVTVLGAPVLARGGVAAAGVPETGRGPFVSRVGEVRAVRVGDRLARGTGAGGPGGALEPDLEAVRRRGSEVLDVGPVDDDPAEAAAADGRDSDGARACRRRVQVRPQRCEHVVRPCRVREMLGRERDVAARTTADDDVAVGHHADARVWLAAVVERRHREVRDRVVAHARDGRDAEQRQSQVAAVGAVTRRYR